VDSEAAGGVGRGNLGRMHSGSAVGRQDAVDAAWPRVVRTAPQGARRRRRARPGPQHRNKPHRHRVPMGLGWSHAARGSLRSRRDAPQASRWDLRRVAASADIPAQGGDGQAHRLRRRSRHPSPRVATPSNRMVVGSGIAWASRTSQVPANSLGEVRSNPNQFMSIRLFAPPGSAT